MKSIVNNSQDKKDIVKSLDRTLEIIDVLARTPHAMSAQQLSDALGVNRTTLYAALNTLCMHQYIEKDESDGRFSIGYRMYEIGLKYKYKYAFIPIAEEYAMQLYMEFNHPVNLGVFHPPSLTIQLLGFPASSVYAPFLVPSTYIMPSYACAVGKVLLASKDEKDLRKCLDTIEFKAYTSNTIDNEEKLIRELEQIRTNGYALDREEYFDNVNCMAVPIKNYQNDIIASISVSGMSADFLEKNLESLQSALFSVARQISLGIGWKP